MPSTICAPRKYIDDKTLKIEALVCCFYEPVHREHAHFSTGRLELNCFS